MNNYQFLVSEREQGRFGEYMRRGLIGLNLSMWMEIYQYHLEHPEASTWFVANTFDISQKHVRNIYSEWIPRASAPDISLRASRC